jgi:hypothetical protein
MDRHNLHRRYSYFTVQSAPDEETALPFLITGHNTGSTSATCPKPYYHIKKTFFSKT